MNLLPTKPTPPFKLGEALIITITMPHFHTKLNDSAFNKTWHPLELRQVFCCESLGILCHIQVKLTEQKKEINHIQNNSQFSVGVFTSFNSLVLFCQIHSFNSSFLFLLVLSVLQKLTMCEIKVHIFGCLKWSFKQFCAELKS